MTEQPISLTNVVSGVLGAIALAFMAWFAVAIVMEVAESEWWQKRNRDTSCVGVGRYQHLPPRNGSAIVFDTCTGRYWRGYAGRWDVVVDSIRPAYNRACAFDSLLNELDWR